MWQSYIADKRMDQVTATDLRAFLVWLRDEYKPKRFDKRTTPLSGKTLQNMWIALSVFFTWANKDFGTPSPMKNVPTPQFEEAPVEPFSKEAVEAVLRATDSCRPARTDFRHAFVMRRASVHRDRTMILILLCGRYRKRQQSMAGQNQDKRP